MVLCALSDRPGLVHSIRGVDRLLLNVSAVLGLGCSRPLLLWRLLEVLDSRNLMLCFLKLLLAVSHITVALFF